MNNNTTPQRSTFSSVRMTHEQACSLLGIESPLVAAKSKKTSQSILQTTKTSSNTLDGRILSAHQGQGKAPLKDVSNMKKPSNTPATTSKVKVRKMIRSVHDEEKVAGGAGPFKPKLSKMTIKLNEVNLRLLNQVSSQWRTGKGVCQTPLCMEAIRTCLKESIPVADLANYVAAGLSEEIQAMELKRAKACAARINVSMKDGEKKAKRKAKAMSMSMGETSLASECGMEIQMNGPPPYSAHTLKAGDHTFTVDSKYNFIRVMGSGAYGVVISARNTNLNTQVAIKKVPKAFQDEIDAKRILREIKLLKHMKHDNIVGIVDMVPPMTRYVDDFHDVYIVSELMETDLHRIICSNQALSIDHVKYFVYQILRALKYIHSANVLHRDLKPSNLLVNSDCLLKVCDFGLARGVLDENQMKDQSKRPLLTEYIVTRWYRAPEIMLACHEYDKPVDVWSVGCILAELLARKPYLPGNEYIHQLKLITSKLGKLPEKNLDFVTSEKARRFMRNLPNNGVVPLSKQFPNAPPECIDLLRKMLQIHPKKRITVEEALKHPFMSQLHKEEDEPVCEHPFDYSFEDEKLHRIRLKELIWEEVGDFRPHCLPAAPRRDGTQPPTRRT